MDVLKHTYTVLSVIIEAIQSVQGAKGSHRSGEAKQKWGLELKFCLSLKSTLEDLIAWQPSDAKFTYDYELRCLINAVSEYLECLCDVLVTIIPTLENSTDRFDQSNPEHAARLESQLENSVAVPVGALRKQIGKYIPAVNALLVLYIIAVLRSPPLGPIPEEQVADIQSIGERAKIPFTPNLLKLLHSPTTIQMLDDQKQQELLNSLQRDARIHWQSVQVTMYGDWADAMDLSEDELPSVQSDGPVAPRTLPASNHGEQRQDPPRNMYTANGSKAILSRYGFREWSNFRLEGLTTTRVPQPFMLLQ